MQTKSTENGIISVWGEINDKNALDIIKDLHDYHTNNVDVIMYINSDGGNIESAISIIDMMEYFKSRGMKIYTVVCGRACSAAVNILSAGTTKYATENSIFMIHQSHYELPGDYDHIQKVTVDFWTKTSRDFLNKVILSLKPKYRKQTSEKLKSGYWLSTEDALKIGLIDKIWK